MSRVFFVWSQRLCQRQDKALVARLRRLLFSIFDVWVYLWVEGQGGGNNDTVEVKQYNEDNLQQGNRPYASMGWA